VGIDANNEWVGCWLGNANEVTLAVHAFFWNLDRYLKLPIRRLKPGFQRLNLFRAEISSIFVTFSRKIKVFKKIS
jgi:hypothetical protein